MHSLAGPANSTQTAKKPLQRLRNTKLRATAKPNASFLRVGKSSRKTVVILGVQQTWVGIPRLSSTSYGTTGLLHM